jgi:hypothetical protein
MLEQIISRGATRPELTALHAGRFFGLRTGGTTRIHRGRKDARIIQRLGLSADNCSRRQAMVRNIRAADGTLVFGRFGAALEALLKDERTHYFCLESARKESVDRIAPWIKLHHIRTLNVSGQANLDARRVMNEVLQQLGRAPALPVWDGPTKQRPAVLADDSGFYAVAMSPRPRAWQWNEMTECWSPMGDWRTVPILRDENTSRAARFWERVPEPARSWALHGRSSPDLDLLETLGSLGKPADDLARAGRWAILRLLGNASELLPPERSSVGELRSLVRRRQRDIAGYFGFPATQASAAALAKVPRLSCSLSTVLLVRDLLSSEETAAALARLPRINREVVDVLADPWLRKIAGARLLRELSLLRDDEAGEDEPEMIWLALEGIKTQAERTGRSQKIGVIHSIRRLQEIFYDLMDLPSVEWPKPPASLQGVTGLIEPLLSIADVAAEAAAMHHCVGTYSRAMMQGRVLLFRVMADARMGTERATLEFRPGPNGQWHVGQLSGPYNQPVSAKTRQLVERWRISAQVAGSEMSALAV